MSDAAHKFKDLFCSEAGEHLETISHLLLQIERNPSRIESYQEMMRSAHTIKGGAATMGFTELAKLAHALEDLFHSAERGALVFDHNIVSSAFSALDVLKESLRSVKEENLEIKTDEHVEAIEALLHGEVAQGGQKESGEVMKDKPKVDPIEKQFLYQPPSSIRVDVERLNTLMGSFEEMLMLRLKLDTILEPATEIMKSMIDPVLKQKIYFLNDFKTLFSELARSLSDAQTELLQIRLVALDELFGQFPRMVRDLSLREDKNITLEITGQDVALDRTVLDGLGGALAHLLRNAVDHGIVKEGIIRLSARRKNDRVHIVVEDNGAGVDYDAVREVALNQHIISSDEAKNMRTTEIAELLFHQNLSTSKTVTDISGRGVGLASVRSFAQEVGGRVSVSSPVSDSGGTKFILDLPVSLATVKVLLVESSGFTFALPFTSVVRTISFPRSGIVSSAHQESLIIDGKSVPLLRLSVLLEITFADMFRPKNKSEGDELLAVLVDSGEGHVAILVEECVGEQELLVKSLPPLLSEVKGFSGSTLLPDGRTILLIDTQGLLHQAFDDILEKR